MMSGHAVRRSDSDEDLKIFFCTPNNREGLLPYQSQWMTHRMQRCSSSSLHGCKPHAVSDISNKDHRNEQEYLSVKSIKSRETKMFSIGMNRSIFECVTMRRSNPDESNLTSGVLQSAETEKNRFDIISNSVVRENVSSFDSRIVSSSKILPEQLTESYLNKGKYTANFFMNSDDLNSQLEHFPIADINEKIKSADINEKIKSILAPKKKFRFGILTTKKTGIDSTHGNQMIRESTISSEAKGTAFFQMSTSPTMSYFNGQRESSRNDQHRAIGMDMETLDGSSDKANTIYVNVSQTPSSAGLTSLQKDLVCSKFEPIAASPIRQSFFNNPTYANGRALSTTKTDEKNSHLLIPEETNRWIKRLRHNPSDSLRLSSKRFKSGEVLSSTLDYGKPNPTPSKNISVKKRSDCSSEEWKSMRCWIRRWSRRKADGNLRSVAPVLCEPEKLKWSKLMAPLNFEPVCPKEKGEDFEGGSNLPSIMGLALMGKAATNFRPCKFRQKGSCLVWNVEGF